MKTKDRRSRRAPNAGSRLLPSNWRVRPRLVALIMLPTAAAVLLGGLQLSGSLSGANTYRRMTEVAALVDKLGTLSYELAEERDLTSWYIADRRNSRRLAKVREQREEVDRTRADVLAAIDALSPDQPARVRAETTRMRNWLRGLPGLRKPLTEGGVLPRAALDMYSDMIDDLTTLYDDLGRSGGDERLIGDALALGALTQAREQSSRLRGILLVGRIEGRFDFDDPAQFLGAWQDQLNQVAAFRAAASPTDIKRFDNATDTVKAARADASRALVMSRMRENRGLPRTLRINDWFDTSSALVDGMRTVERGMSTAVVARSQELEAAERRSAIIFGAAIAVLLVLILLITAWVAGTLVRPLRRLRSEALEVADTRLPETVRTLRESGDHAPDVEVPSIGVVSRDEIGEVARAFDEVHREAIRLAGDEARLRSNVNSMFVNLSRRTQSLVERQIDLIDDLEQGEQDEGRLANLFKLDHLATRMRRNSENLLVLAGQEQSRRWSEPVPLSDVVRASLSEVENYERVALRVEGGISIIGSAVNDIVHLIAELVENAIFFSPQDTKITVGGNVNETGAVILAVTDAGIGMSDEELGEANRRLAEPPAVDLSVSRRMGLFVVGRLAMRHGIRVQLRSPESGGLSAVVMLPPQVVAQGSPELALTGPGASQSSFAGSSFSDAFGGASFGGTPAATDSFGGRSNAGPFGGAPAAADPFGGAPAGGSFDRSSSVFGSPGDDGPDPFGSGWGDSPRRPAAPERPSTPERPPAVAQPPAASPTADLWSSPVVPASAVEDLWSSPLTSVPPAFPSARPDPAPGETSGPGRGGPGRPGTGQPSGTPAGPSAPSPSWPEMPPADPWTPPRREPAQSSPSLPAVEVSATEPEPEEFLPIFAAVGSDWFRSSASVEQAAPPDLGDARPEPEPEAAADRRPEPSVEEPLPVRQPRPVERAPWSSPADEGWAAAKAAKEPSLGGVTGSGLPKRVPKANLVPGSATPAQASPPPIPPLSAERVRSRLSSFQQGIRQGRAEMNERLNAAEREKQ
ncbi:nitrate- and nitrite sensing domain-containing protein [Streptosporangium sp. NPDC004379]|uniref:sensor histidine kinase n=1 Tax=Streptosporangium sp. NPDC004379 TaxID=3366189 RepID=UPI00368D9E24